MRFVENLVPRIKQQKLFLTFSIVAKNRLQKTQEGVFCNRNEVMNQKDAKDRHLHFCCSMSKDLQVVFQSKGDTLKVASGEFHPHELKVVMGMLFKENGYSL